MSDSTVVVYNKPITGVPSYDETAGYTVSSNGTIATYTLAYDSEIVLENANTTLCGVSLTSSSEDTIIDTGGTVLTISSIRDVASTGMVVGAADGIAVDSQSVTFNEGVSVYTNDLNTKQKNGTVYGYSVGMAVTNGGTIVVNGDATIFDTTAGYSTALYLSGTYSLIVINGDLNAESDSSSTDYLINNNDNGHITVTGNTTLTAYGIYPSDNVNAIWNPSVSASETFENNLYIFSEANGSTAAGIRNNGIVDVWGNTTITVIGSRTAVGIWAQNKNSKDYYGGSLTVTVGGGRNTYGDTYGIYNNGYTGGGYHGYMTIKGLVTITATNGTFEGSSNAYGILNFALMTMAATQGTDVITVTGNKTASNDTGAYIAAGITNAGNFYIGNSVNITVSQDVNTGISGYKSGLGWAYGIQNASSLYIAGSAIITIGSLSAAATSYGIYNDGHLTIAGGLTLSSGPTVTITGSSSLSKNYGIVTECTTAGSAITMIDQSGTSGVAITGNVITNSNGTYAGTIDLNLNQSGSYLEGLVTTDTDGTVGQANVTFGNGADWIVTGTGAVTSDFGTGTLILGNAGEIDMASYWGNFSGSSVPDYSYRTLTIDGTTLDSGTVSLENAATLSMLSDIGNNTADEVIFGAGVDDFAATGTLYVGIAYDPLLESLAASGTATAGEIVTASSVIVIADASAAAGGTATFSAVQGVESSYVRDGITLDYTPILELNADHTQVLLKGIEINEVLCLCAGTRLATPAGERAVEELAPGDMVLTAQGPCPVRWVGHRAYDGRFIAGNHLALPVCIRRGALAPEVPTHDLTVSPGHGIWLRGALMPAWRLVNGLSITQAETVESVHYYNVELEGHGLLLAHGATVESFLDAGQFRNLFQNAAEYHALYPGGPRCREIVALPRIERGFALATIQAEINARAGLYASPRRPGPLRGYVDGVNGGFLWGWAQDDAAPEEPVVLAVFAGKRRLARIIANGYRADLSAAGLGRGCHGFELQLRPGYEGEIRVCRALDGAQLLWTDAAGQAA